MAHYLRIVYSCITISGLSGAQGLICAADSAKKLDEAIKGGRLDEVKTLLQSPGIRVSTHQLAAARHELEQETKHEAAYKQIIDILEDKPVPPAVAAWPASSAAAGGSPASLAGAGPTTPIPTYRPTDDILRDWGELGGDRESYYRNVILNIKANPDISFCYMCGYTGPHVITVLMEKEKPTPLVQDFIQYKDHSGNIRQVDDAILQRLAQQSKYPEHVLFLIRVSRFHVYVIEKSGDGTTSWYRIYQSWHHGFILAEWLGISKFQSNGLFGSLYDEYKKFGLGKKLNLSQVYDFMQSITDLIKEKYGPEAGIEMFIPDIDIIRTPSKQYWAAALENFPIAQSGSEINSLLLYSVHQADNEIARYALENSANVNTRYNDNSTALIVAIKMFNNELISLLLNRPDIDVSVIPNDLFKRSAFQLATTTKNKKAVKLLLKTGKQFRKKDFNFIQSVLPDKEIEKLLLNATATP